MANIGEKLKSSFSDAMVYAKIVLRKDEHGDEMGGIFSGFAEEEIVKKVNSFSPKGKVNFLIYAERKTNKYCDVFREVGEYEDLLNMESSEYVESIIQAGILEDLIGYLKNAKTFKRQGKIKESNIESFKIIETLDRLSDKAKGQMIFSSSRIKKKFKNYINIEDRVDMIDFDKNK